MEDMAALHISGRSHSQKLINNIIIDCVFVHYLEIRVFKNISGYETISNTNWN